MNIIDSLVGLYKLSKCEAVNDNSRVRTAMTILP